VVAALLTIAGYSINDTIVVFDRIRERSKALRKEKHSRVMDIAVNETLSRTVITAFTVFLTALALLIWGGEVLRRLLARHGRRRRVRHVFFGVRGQRPGARHLDLAGPAEGHSGRMTEKFMGFTSLAQFRTSLSLAGLLGLAALATSCEKKSPVDPATGPAWKGIRSESQLIAWRDTPDARLDLRRPRQCRTEATATRFCRPRQIY
jgi:hypothetical protein